MSQLLSLGAINKLTGEYVYPKIANKKDEYICPECNKDLILVQGEIRIHHFRHKVDSINPCHHYSKPTESQIHKDAKMLMKTLLENKTHIQFIRECVSCKISAEINLPEITEGSIITLEHRFNYHDELRIADVAHTLNGEIKGIYEICHTHKTCSENRPEPWVEIDANSLLTLVNANIEPLLINCIRCEKCEDCYNKKLKLTDLIKYIRIKLGQDFENPIYDERDRQLHDRFDFHAQSCGKCGNCGGGKESYSCNDYIYEHNKKICDIFNNDNDLGLYRIVLYVWKGHTTGYLIYKDDYNNYDYWNTKYRYDGTSQLKIPYEYTQEYCGGGSGTVLILEDLIKKSIVMFENIQKNKYKYNPINDIYKFGILKKGDMDCDLCNKNIKCGDKIGWYKYSPDAYCEKCYIDKINYIFITTKISIPPTFEKTQMLYMCIDRDIEEYDEIPSTSLVMVDCKNNFTEEEKTIINELKIHTIEDLIRNEKISKNDKQRCLKCFGYVRESYESMGIEPFNGHNIIQLGKYVIDIRILPDGIVKYCRSLGEKNVEKDFTKIQMGI